MFHLLISNLGVVLEFLLKGGEGGKKFGNCNKEVNAGQHVYSVEKQDLIVIDLKEETCAYLHREQTEVTGTQVMVTLDEAANIANKVTIIIIAYVYQ